MCFFDVRGILCDQFLVRDLVCLRSRSCPFLVRLHLQKSRTKSYTFFFRRRNVHPNPLSLQVHCSPNQFSSKLDFDRISVVVRIISDENTVKRKRNNKKQDSKGGAKQARSCVFAKTRFTPVHVFVRLRFGATRVYGVWEEVGGPGTSGEVQRG